MKLLSLSGLALLALSIAACASNTDANATDEATGELSAAAPITIDDWISHPKIVEIRNIVDAIDAKDLPSESKELCQDSGHGEMERTKLTDDSGKIRELVDSFGSEDSAQIESHYYDTNGVLRFVLITRNDVHGNAEESRAYFDASGAQIWSVYRHAFAENLNPDIANAPYVQQATEVQDAAKDPQKLYDAPPRCD